jgi:site-specific DNA recombinase
MIASANDIVLTFSPSFTFTGRAASRLKISRISAPEIEARVESAVSERLKGPREEMFGQIESVIVSKGGIRLALKQAKGKRGLIQIPWTPRPKGTAQVIAASETKVDQKLVKSIIRAHAWLAEFSSGHYSSIEDLAAAAHIHPKVVRQGLRLAFLPPELTRAVLDAKTTIKLKQIPKLLPLSWREQHQSVG